VMIEITPDGRATGVERLNVALRGGSGDFI